MKTLKNLTLAILLTPTLLLAQNNEEMIHMDQQHKTEIFLEQNLSDFNAKYHSAFIASYKGFNDFKVDFQNGKNEHFSKENKQNIFNVSYSSNQDELIAVALQKEVANRIMTVSPKGYVQSSERVNSKEVFTITFDPKEQEKSTFQPVTLITLDYETLTVQIQIIEPSRK